MYRLIRIAFGPGRQVATSGIGYLMTGQGCVTYLEAFETTGSASASFSLLDGVALSGRQITDWTVSSGQSSSETYMLHCLPFLEGLFLNTATGAVAGSITVWADHDCARALELGHLAREAELAEAGHALGLS